MKNPFFSIIVPTYNRESFIYKTLMSLLNQTFTDFEVIVVDDGSTDETESIVRNIDADNLFYYKIENGERAKARNFGAVEAKGKYLNFFDSDDIAKPFHLEKAYNLIKKYGGKKVNIFALGYQWVLDGEVINEVKYPSRLNEFLSKGNVFACNPVFVKREVFLENRFNEDRELSGSEDYELWLRLASQYEIYYDNTITSSLIQHDERSVNELNKEKLILRLNLLSKYIQEDGNVVSFYKNNLKTILAENLSYISLHLAIGNEKKDSLKYLLQAIGEDFKFIFRRRFLGIIKNLILN